jgi:hypothetical protein
MTVCDFQWPLTPSSIIMTDTTEIGAGRRPSNIPTLMLRAKQKREQRYGLYILKEFLEKG